jgi:hypothetical protein
MLLEFRLENFRSFKEESVLSLVTSSTDKNFLDTNTIATGIAAAPRVVRSAVLYGPNASGKSNFLRGLLRMRGIIVESAMLPPQANFNVQAFRLARETLKEPCLFEATVVIDGVRYQYGFEVTPTRVVAEWLLVYVSAKPQIWFDRRWDETTGKETFKLGTGLKGPKQVWRDATRPNALYLSTAAQLNSEPLSPLYRWFAESLHVLPSNGNFADVYSTDRIQDPEWKRRITSFMNSADIAIFSISAQKQEGAQVTFKVDAAAGGVMESHLEKGEILRPRFTHVVGDISAEMELGDESDGTQKLFALAGPVFDILQKGLVLVVDELDRSLHEHLLRQFVRLFHDPDINQRGAQLIFSTHASSLLEGGLLRRDQVSFVEKGNDQASYLVPLSDYSARKGEALDRGYRAGRYGGIPMLPNRLIEKADLGTA